MKFGEIKIVDEIAKSYHQTGKLPDAETQMRAVEALMLADLKEKLHTLDSESLGRVKEFLLEKLEGKSDDNKRKLFKGLIDYIEKLEN